MKIEYLQIENIEIIIFLFMDSCYLLNCSFHFHPGFLLSATKDTMERCIAVKSIERQNIANGLMRL